MKKLNLSLVILLAFFSIIGFTGCKDPEIHEHTFSDSWSKNETHHWHAATCEHTTEVSGKAEHTFGDWSVTTEATEEAEGSKERTCTVCGYKATEVIAKLAHTHKFATDWTKDETHHWHAATCEHTTEVSEKAKHTFGDWTTTKEATEEEVGSKERICSVCNYKETAEIEKLVHTHKFSNDWTYDGAYHWHAATCEHTTEVSDKVEHDFGVYISNNDATFVADGTKTRTCTVCNYAGTVTDEGSKLSVLIPAGTFQMGSTAGDSDEKPVHAVTLTKDFYMSKYEVTQGEYEKYCSYGGSSPSDTYGDGDNYPAYYVSWYDALVYCNKRSIDEGFTPCYSINEETDPTKWGRVPTSIDSTWNGVVCNWEANGYRLPTEAEWEYAARAGATTTSSLTYSGTSDVNEFGDYAWYDDNSSSKTHQVGTKKANAFGLYDMSGNVWEWCWNWYTSSYDTTTDGGNDPTGALSGSYRVRRGGSWVNGANYASVSGRYDYNPYNRYRNLGFRVVRSAN